MVLIIKIYAISGDHTFFHFLRTKLHLLPLFLEYLSSFQEVSFDLLLLGLSLLLDLFLLDNLVEMSYSLLCYLQLLPRLRLLYL